MNGGAPYVPGQRLTYTTVREHRIPVVVDKREDGQDKHSTWVRVTSGSFGSVGYPRGLVVNVSNLWLAGR